MRPDTFKLTLYQSSRCLDKMHQLAVPGNLSQLLYGSVGGGGGRGACSATHSVLAIDSQEVHVVSGSAVTGIMYLN